MGNSQKKGAKSKKDQEEQRRDSEEEESDEEEPREDCEAEAYLDLEICYKLKNGTTTKFTLNPSSVIQLDHFKEDIQHWMKTDKRIEVYRDNMNDPLGPSHLTLEALNICTGDVLTVIECVN